MIDLANIIEQDIKQLVKEKNYKSTGDTDAELYTYHNMSEDLDEEGYLVKAAEIDLPYLIGYSKNGGLLTCYNFTQKLQNLTEVSEEEFKEVFLSYFNNYFNKDYKEMFFVFS